MPILIWGSGNKKAKLQSKTVSPSKKTQTVTPDETYDGLSKVIVNAIDPTGKIDNSIRLEDGKQGSIYYISPYFESGDYLDQLRIINIPNFKNGSCIGAYVCCLDNRTSTANGKNIVSMFFDTLRNSAYITYLDSSGIVKTESRVVDTWDNSFYAVDFEQTELFTIDISGTWIITPIYSA